MDKRFSVHNNAYSDRFIISTYKTDFKLNTPKYTSEVIESYLMMQ